MNLRAEIDHAIRSRRISSPLQACIKEGLRLWPPTTAPLFKLAPEGGDVIAGVFIPAGTKVGICAWAMFRDPKVFGADVNLFRPERWLEADEERLQAMERSAELIWSPGKWQCLGKPIALMELSKVFVEVGLF
jgi:cytochrome P450